MEISIVTAMFFYVVLFACVGLLEKNAVTNHHYMHFSTARMFYILIITTVIMFLVQPSALSSKAFHTSMKDPVVMIIGVFTALAIILYYWMLSKKDLWLMTMSWPVVMLLTIIGACVFIKEKISLRQWIGIFVTYVGLFITFIHTT